MDAAIPDPNRSIGEATDHDAKLALNSPSEYCEWTFWDQVFIISHKQMVIARIEGASGFPYIAWALKYDNLFSMLRDWQEILSVPESIRTRRDRG